MSNKEPAFQVTVDGYPHDVMTAAGTKITVNGKEIQNVESFDYKIDGFEGPDRIVRTRVTIVLAGAQVGVDYNPPPPPPPFTAREKRMAKVLAEGTGKPACEFYDRARYLLRRRA
jgi:hypothetical protein